MRHKCTPHPNHVARSGDCSQLKSRTVFHDISPPNHKLNTTWFKEAIQQGFATYSWATTALGVLLYATKLCIPRVGKIFPIYFARGSPLIFVMVYDAWAMKDDYCAIPDLAVKRELLFIAYWHEDSDSCVSSAWIFFCWWKIALDTFTQSEAYDWFRVSRWYCTRCILCQS